MKTFASRGAFALQQAGLFRHIGERAVTVVTVELVVAVVGHKDIVVAVVVVIANADAHGPAAMQQAGLLRHVGKSAVAVIVVEPVGRAGRNTAEPAAGGSGVTVVEL